VTREEQYVSPISREREYERRRYENWQAKLADKLRRRQRQRQRLIIAGSAVAVLLAAGGAVYWIGHDDSSPGSAALTASNSPSAPAGTASVPASASAVPASAGPNPCPAVTVKPAAKPQSFPTAPDAALAQGKTWKLTLTTTCGVIQADLDGAKAPKAVANAIFLSGKNFWDSSMCHRLSTVS
jgi:peptidyl-prolyl cis-trans isomerase B (cyclophilin B)